MTTPTTPKVADRIAETMHGYGVRFAFGIPGNDVLEHVRACTAAGIRFVVTKSEPSAAFMADAVAQVTGRPAACIFALGPGIANGVSGVAGALMERSPVIVLGGEIPCNRRAIYNHQVFDHVAVMTTVTKYAAELNPERAAQQAARALDIATAHPQGPVFLNCPADAARLASNEAVPARPEPRGLGVLSAADLDAAAAALAWARKPLALVGRGILHKGGPKALQAFLEGWRVPFFATYKAKGVLPESHPLCLGAVALSPVIDDVSLGLVREADLIVLAGFDPIELRDAWLDAWPPGQRVLSVDWTVAAHRIFPTGRQLAGDVPDMLRQLAGKATPKSTWEPARLGRLRQEVAHIVRPREPDGRISPAGLFHAVSRRVTTDMLLTVDVGAHRILANHVIRCVTPGQLLQSNGLGCMGYAIPAAIGAALGAPDKAAVAMLGDGCALMSLGELALVAELGLPVVTIILNDASLALIELKQDKLGMAKAGVTFRSPNFAEISRGFGIAAERVTAQAGFEASFERAIASRKPALLEAIVDPREYWEQM
jgi:acetolactate synthase-1/2/3 large subunit